jgi:hypothetical protein
LRYDVWEQLELTVLFHACSAAKDLHMFMVPTTPGLLHAVVNEEMRRLCGIEETPSCVEIVLVKRFILPAIRVDGEQQVLFQW